MRERRASPRLKESLPLVVDDEQAKVTTETANLSTSGAYCTIDRFIAPMTKVKIRLTIPNRNRSALVSCTGVVVRVEPVITPSQTSRYHVAIFFTELSDRDRSAISQYVQQRLQAHRGAQ